MLKSNTFSEHSTYSNCNLAPCASFLSLKIVACLFLCLLSSCTTSELQPDKRDKYVKAGTMIVSEARGHLNAQLYQLLIMGDVKSAIVGGCRIGLEAKLDSLSKKRGVEIGRVSSKNRNPMNSPSKIEGKKIKEYAKIKKEDATSSTMKAGSKVVFYSPIYMDATCLRCHGEPGSTLDNEAYEFTKKLYPDDKAIGYKDGDFGGVWTITFMEGF